MGENQGEIPLRDEQAQRRTTERKQNALNEQLTHDTPAAAAHGGAHGKLVDAPTHARKLHIGDVRASD